MATIDENISKTASKLAKMRARKKGKEYFRQLGKKSAAVRAQNKKFDSNYYKELAQKSLAARMRKYEKHHENDGCILSDREHTIAMNKLNARKKEQAHSTNPHLSTISKFLTGKL